MKFANLFLLITVLGSTSLATTFSLPQGKGKCPHFSFEGEKEWTLKSDRPKGDRWKLIDSKTKTQIARFDFDLGNTDQKQLPEVEDKDIQLGSFKLHKLTVTSSFPEEGQKATEGLITSYSYKDGKLKGLVVMSEEYSATEALDKKIEKMLTTIKLN